MAAISDEPGGREASAWQMLASVIDLVTPLAVRAAAGLALADLMVDGPVPVAELAERSGTHRDALERLLRHLAAHGVFAEPEPGVFGLNEAAELLRSDHPAGMRTALDLEGFGGRMDLVFTGVLHTLRTGEPAWEKVFGAPYWRYLAENPEMSASFDAMMSVDAGFVAQAVASYDWSGARHVVDVGGGAGTLLAAILDAHPHLRGTLVDLPDTVRRGRELLSERGLSERAEVVGQSFFDPLPTGGDVYVLSSVVHDWGDAEAVAILRRCAEAAGADGRVVVLEQHSAEDGDPAQFAEMNLRMLVIAGGRERRLEEYRALAIEAGLAVTDVRTTQLGQVRLECVPEPR